MFRHADPHTRFAFGALSLADPMGPPPSVVRGRGNGSKGTPGLLGLSRRPADRHKAISDRKRGSSRRAVQVGRNAELPDSRVNRDEGAEGGYSTFPHRASVSSEEKSLEPGSRREYRTVTRDFPILCASGRVGAAPVGRTKRPWSNRSSIGSANARSPELLLR